MQKQKNPITQLFKNPWPVTVTDAVNEQIKWQETLQISAINDTLNLDKDSIHDRINRGFQMSKRWCDIFGVKYE